MTDSLAERRQGDTAPERRDGEGVASDVETFLSALDAQMAIYDRLGKLVARQRRLIASEDPSPLLTLLGERQAVTRELAASVERLGPIQATWDALRDRMSDEQRTRARELLHRMRSFLREITTADGEDTRRLEVRKRCVADALRGMAPRGAMLSAYGSPRRTTTGALNRMDGNE